MTEKAPKQKKSRRGRAKVETPDAVEAPFSEVAADESAGTAAEQPPVEQPDEAAVFKDQLLRLKADFENFRKRTARERSDIYKRANEELLEELLPVIDHMDLALLAAKPEDEQNAFVQGFRMIQGQLCDALSKFGLETIKTKDAAFDPNVHEAIAHLPSETVAENFVMEQTRRGYMLGGRLLRAAQVVVSSGSVASDAVSADEPVAEPIVETPESDTPLQEV